MVLQWGSFIRLEGHLWSIAVDTRREESATVSQWWGIIDALAFHNLKRIIKIMGGYCAHFLFDALQGFSCKGVFFLFG